MDFWEIERSDKMKKIACTDHEGNNFESLKQMCDYWKINEATFCLRIKNGMNLEDALRKPSRTVMDHKGIVYENLEKMCLAYETSVDVVNYRIEHGWTLKDALEKKPERNKVSKSFVCKDHEGNFYSSVSEMCRKYKISRSLFLYRIRQGKSLSEALGIV